MLYYATCLRLETLGWPQVHGQVTLKLTSPSTLASEQLAASSASVDEAKACLNAAFPGNFTQQLNTAHLENLLWVRNSSIPERVAISRLDLQRASEWQFDTCAVRDYRQQSLVTMTLAVQQQVADLTAEFPLFSDAFGVRTLAMLLLQSYVEPSGQHAMPSSPTCWQPGGDTDQQCCPSHSRHGLAAKMA
jgi:hypothetical protein